MFTKEMINDYADKLLIGLTDDEVKILLDEFDVIKENMEIIANIDGLSDVEPMHFPTDYTINSLRSGNTVSNLDRNSVLSNCKDAIEDVISVPKVVD